MTVAITLRDLLIVTVPLALAWGGSIITLLRTTAKMSAKLDSLFKEQAQLRTDVTTLQKGAMHHIEVFHSQQGA